MEEEKLTLEQRKDNLDLLDYEISKAKKEEEKKKVENYNLKHYIEAYEGFRKVRNEALKANSNEYLKKQSWMLGIYAIFCLLVLGGNLGLLKCNFCKCTNNWIVVAAFMVLGLAAIITLGLGLSKFLSSMSSNLKADADANRKLNATIDEKVMGKMG